MKTKKNNPGKTVIKTVMLLLIILVIKTSELNAQDTVSIVPVMDNTLYEDAAGLISNSRGKYMFSGKSTSGLKRRAVINFQTIEFIPPCSKILSVKVKLHSSGPVTANKTIQLKKLNKFCGEGTSDAPGTEENGTASTLYDGTWKHTYYNTDLWTAPGGDYSGTVSASTTVGGTGYYYWSSPQLISDVESWSDLSQNFGWIILGDESTSNSYKRFHTKESDTAEYYPELIVVYEQRISLYLISKVEGFWDGTNTVDDTLKVYLRNSFAPYALKDSAKEVSGNFGATYCFTNAPTGNYYIVASHRNSIETWSSLLVLLTRGDGDYYDFTDLVTRAYGSNTILKYGAYCFYSGDVNQDGIIDASDVSSVENDASIGLSSYVKTDVTGDDFVDAGDVSVVENNSSISVAVITP
ncbi:MAG: hypothetical protein LH629_03820 [Ignavibacteria bacterium]|nr:hypothetical protein [Ignavibacteria bacterium]